MWAKHFSVDLKWLKKVLIFSTIFAVLAPGILLGLKWDRIVYPNSFKEIEKNVITPGLSASTTLSKSDRIIIQNVFELLESKKLVIGDIHVDEWRYVYIDTDLAQIIFSLKTSNQKIINTLITIIDNKLFQATQKNGDNMLEYIDIRFGNKVFYKYKNGKQLATTTIQTNILEQSTTTGR